MVPLAIFFSGTLSGFVDLCCIDTDVHSTFRHKNASAEPQQPKITLQRHCTAELRHNYVTSKLVAKACCANKCAFIYAFVKILIAL